LQIFNIPPPKPPEVGLTLNFYYLNFAPRMQKVSASLRQQGIEGHAAATCSVVTASGLRALMRKGVEEILHELVQNSGINKINFLQVPGI
jgi:hypothetical protein